MQIGYGKDAEAGRIPYGKITRKFMAEKGGFIVKKILFLVLIAILSLSFVSAEDVISEQGELLRIHGYTDGVLVFESMYLDPHDGPGYEYFPVPVSLDNGTTVRVLTQTAWSGTRWVLVETGNIRFYMIQQDNMGRTLIDCDMSSVPVEPGELTDEDRCELYVDTPLMYGPGYDYEQSPFFAAYDDSGYVVLMNGEWALVEFMGDTEHTLSGLGQEERTRVWIEMSKLQY